MSKYYMELHEVLLKYFSTFDGGMHYDINNDSDVPKELKTTMIKIIRDRVIISKYTYNFTSPLTIDNIHLRNAVEKVALSLNDNYQCERINLLKYLLPKSALIELIQIPSKFLHVIFPRIDDNKPFLNFITWSISLLITIFKSDIKNVLISLF